MNSESRENEDLGDPDDRIAELEAQVAELSGLVERLVHDKEDADSAQSVEPESAGAGRPGKKKGMLARGVAEGMGRALGGEAGESLESRIGGIWLSRVATVLALTAIVLGGAMTLREDSLTALHKVGIGYGLSVFAILYGLISRRKHDLFPQSILGSGLAALYFTTYAAFYIEASTVFAHRELALPALGACMVLLVVIAHYRRSQSVAGISLFLIYYTVVLSLTEGTSTENVTYGFVTCAMVSVVALIFHLTHRWLFFTWAALLSTQLTYLYFFFVKPPVLELSDETYFWVSNGFLALTYVLFSLAAVTDARRTGEFRKTVAPMAGVNSFVFFVLTWLSIRDTYVEYEWAFRLGFAASLGIFALYAHWAGPRRNYLYQIFIAKTVVMFTLALQAYLSHEWLLVAMALESLGLGFSYKRSALVIFKLMGLGLLFIVFAGCLLAVRVPGEVIILNYTMPAKWFTCVAVPLIFAVVAWFYEHFVHRIAPEDREAKGQAFLADSVLDPSGSATSLIYAASGGMILMAITIIDLGGRTDLPFILAAEGVAAAVLGLLLRTPQVEVASVLLILAAHVSYHVFLIVDKPGFETQPSYAPFTGLLAMLTLLGGYLWERYLRRVRGGSKWEHDTLVALPYLAATVLLATLLERQVEGVFVGLADNVFGIALLVVGTLTMLTGIRMAGLAAFAIGTAKFYQGLYYIEDPISRHAQFLPMLCMLVLSYVIAERLVANWHRSKQEVTSTERVVRTMLVTLAAVLGLLGLWEWAPDTTLSFYWLGLAVAAMIIGVAFRESRYRWAALLIYLVAIIRAYTYDLTNLNPLYQFLTFAALCVPLLVISWGYSQYRLHHLRKLRAQRSNSMSSDG